MSLTADEEARLRAAARDAEALAAQKIAAAVIRLRATASLAELVDAVHEVAKEHGPGIARAAVSILLGLVL